MKVLHPNENKSGFGRMAFIGTKSGGFRGRRRKRKKKRVVREKSRERMGKSGSF